MHWKLKTNIQQGNEMHQYDKYFDSTKIQKIFRVSFITLHAAFSESFIARMAMFKI